MQRGSVTSRRTGAGWSPHDWKGGLAPKCDLSTLISLSCHGAPALFSNALIFYSPRSPHRLSRSRPSLRAPPSSVLCRVLLPAWASGVGSRCCRGARARLAGVVSRRTPRMPSSSSLVAIKIAASGPSPETGAAASTPTNKRAIPAAVAAAAAAAAGVAALGVVASITMARGDLIGLAEANDYGITAQNTPKSQLSRSRPTPENGVPYVRPPFSSFSSASGPAGEPCGWGLQLISARQKGRGGIGAGTSLECMLLARTDVPKRGPTEATYV